MDIVKQEVHWSDGSVETLHPGQTTTPSTIVRILGDEELEEMHYASRSAPINNWPSYRYRCPPSVVRFYKAPIEKQGDFRVDISPMLSPYIRLNGETKITDPKTRYFFGIRTAMFNTVGYPMQAYITMQLNQLKGSYVGKDWFIFETLKPTSNVAGMSHESHPWLIHRFDLVCSKKVGDEWQTYHKPNTPQGIIDYFLVTVEGYAYIPARYVKEVV